jgi:hypothetical protein
VQNKSEVCPTKISSVHSIVPYISNNYRDAKCSTVHSKVPAYKKPKKLKENSEIERGGSKMKAFSYSDSSRKTYI